MKLSRRDLCKGSLVVSICLLLAPLAAAAAPAKLVNALDRPAVKIGKPAQALFVSITRAGDRLVAVGERGLIVFSDDQGRNWQQADVPASVTLTTVRFANGNDGWAAGHQGIILQTRDAGRTWRRVFDARTASAGGGAEVADDGPILSLVVKADGTLLAVGAFGIAFTSQDGGSTWTSAESSIPNPEGMSLYGLAERAGQRLLFGEQGLLLTAGANDATFQKAESPTTATVFGAVCLEGGPVLLMGLRGKVFRSASPAEPWVEIQTPVDASLFAGIQLKDRRVLLVGAAGQLLSSADAGRSFKSVSIAQRFPFSGIAATADGAVVLAGARGLLRLEASDIHVAKATVDAPARAPTNKPSGR